MTMHINKGNMFFSAFPLSLSPVYLCVCVFVCVCVCVCVGGGGIMCVCSGTAAVVTRNIHIKWEAHHCLCTMYLSFHSVFQFTLREVLKRQKHCAQTVVCFPLVV
jgi:hypothetical protein